METKKAPLYDVVSNSLHPPPAPTPLIGSMGGHPRPCLVPVNFKVS